MLIIEFDARETANAHHVHRSTIEKVFPFGFRDVDENDPDVRKQQKLKLVGGTCDEHDHKERDRGGNHRR